MMPRIDGVELTRRLRADPMTAALPIIMLTAKGHDRRQGGRADRRRRRLPGQAVRHLGADRPGPLDAAAQPGVPGGLAADRAARQHPDPARDRRPDAHAAPTTRSATSTSTGSRASTTCTASPAATSSSARWPAACTGRSSRPACPRPSSATSAATTSWSSARPDQVRPLTERAVIDFEKAADELYDPTTPQRGYLEVADRRGTCTSGAPGHAVHRGRCLDGALLPPSARGGRGGLRDEDGGQEHRALTWPLTAGSDKPAFPTRSAHCEVDATPG